MKRVMKDFRQQRGAATLAITLIVLLLITLITLFTSRTMIMEQRVSANQYRADQAESAASAALDLGVRLMNGDNIRIDRNADGDTVDANTSPPETLTIANALTNSIACNVSIDENGDGDTTDAGEAKTLRLVGVTAVGGDNCARIRSPAFPANGSTGGATAYIRDPQSQLMLPVTLGFDCRGTCADPPYDVWGFGWSDDGTARHRMVVTAGNADIGGSGRPNLPLTAYGTVDSGGNFKIVNMYNQDNIWTGEDVTLQGTPTTRIWQTGDTAVPNCNLSGNAYTNFVNAHTLLASDPGVGINADIIDQDPNMSALDEDEFWNLFFTVSREELKSMAEAQGHLFSGDDNQLVSKLDGLTGIVWIDGDVQIQSDPEIGKYGYTQNGVDIPAQPAVVVVDGDFETNGQVTFAGLVYVTGNYGGGGGTRFNGMLAVEDERPPGSVSVDKGNGTVDLCYDPLLGLGKSGLLGGAVGIVPGSWRDWNVF